MKIFVTKYALTQGIIEEEAFLLPCESEIYGYYDRGEVTFYYPSEYSVTRDKAIQKANQMRQDKINFLLEQIGKLENLRFE